MIGVFGGSFDPVHRGHVETLLELRRRLPFAEIRVLPAARSPLKPAPSSDTDRLAMLRLALAGRPGLVLDERELRRPPPSYTIDTLRELRAELGPEPSLVFILALDSLLDLPRWKDWRRLTEFAHLLVVSRPGFSPVFAPELADWLKNVQTGEPELLQSRSAGQVLLLETQPWPVASRELRGAIARGGDTRLIDPAVMNYIREHRLYQTTGDKSAQ